MKNRAFEAMKLNWKEIAAMLICVLLLKQFIFHTQTINNLPSSNIDTTQPTFSKSLYLESRNDDNDLEYSCTLKPRIRDYQPSSKVAGLATAVLFQSNGAHQLKNFIAYHGRVIGLEHIVIIDHQSDRNIADALTASLLEDYNKLGSDVWQCDGSFDYKQYMWSDIIHQYTHSTEFVFPLDVDEFIAVKVKKSSKINNEQDEVLSWNADDFANALNQLPDYGLVRYSKMDPLHVMWALLCMK